MYVESQDRLQRGVSRTNQVSGLTRRGGSIPVATKKLVVVTVHGMGATKEDYWHNIPTELKKHLPDSVFRQLVFAPVNYQSIFQQNQNQYWERTKGKLRWRAIRRFVLSSLADAASLEFQAQMNGSPYHRVQIRILNTLRQVLKKQGVDPHTPVAILAHSLGGHVLSCYMWDAARQPPNRGVWKYTQHPKEQNRSTTQGQFLALKTTRLLVTAGCNIPLFVTGYKTIKPFPKPNNQFIWHNYYDKDDVLGWPLRTLSKPYSQLVHDHNAEVEHSLKGWSPLSHTKYWTSKQLMKTIARKCERIVT